MGRYLTEQTIISLIVFLLNTRIMIPTDWLKRHAPDDVKRSFVKRPKKSLQKQLNALKRKVAKQAPENHFHYTSVQGQDVLANVGFFQVLTNPAQGDTELLRTGDEIIPQFLSVDIFFSVTTLNSELFRVGLVQDLHNNDGSAFDWTDVFTETFSLAATQNENQERFKILRDSLVTYDKNSYKFPTMRYKVPLKSKAKMTFDGGAAADLRDGHIYLFCINQVSTSANDAEINHYSKFTFMNK